MTQVSSILHTMSYTALPLLLAMVLHEYAHGRVALYYGDHTAEQAGRLTLNPLVHIDPFGTIVLPLLCLIFRTDVILGYAKPVPVTQLNLRNPRRDMAIVSAAGPFMNLVLAIVSFVIVAGIISLDPTVGDAFSERGTLVPRTDLAGMILIPVVGMCMYSVLINMTLMFFNLLPIPPLDGGRILMNVLPEKHAAILGRVEPYGMLIIFFLVVMDPYLHVFRTLMSPVTLLFQTLLAPASTLSTGLLSALGA